MNRQFIKAVSAIIKQELSDHPNTLFSREAFQIRINNALGKAIDLAIADFVTQGTICNLDCSGNPKRAVYCLTNQRGGDEAVTRQFFEMIVRNTQRA